MYSEWTRWYLAFFLETFDSWSHLHSCSTFFNRHHTLLVFLFPQSLSQFPSMIILFLLLTPKHYNAPETPGLVIISSYTQHVNSLHNFEHSVTSNINLCSLSSHQPLPFYKSNTDWIQLSSTLNFPLNCTFQHSSSFINFYPIPKPHIVNAWPFQVSHLY